MNNLKTHESQVNQQFCYNQFLICNSDKLNDLQKNIEQCLKRQHIHVNNLKYQTQKSYYIGNTYSLTKELETIMLTFNQITQLNKNEQRQINVAFIVESPAVKINDVYSKQMSQFAEQLQSIKNNLNITIFDSSKNQEFYYQLHKIFLQRQIKSTFQKDVTISSVESCFLNFQREVERNNLTQQQQIQRENQIYIDKKYEKLKKEYEKSKDNLDQDIIERRKTLNTKIDQKIKFQIEQSKLEKQELNSTNDIQQSLNNLKKLENELNDVQNKMNIFKNSFKQKQQELKTIQFQKEIAIIQQQFDNLKIQQTIIQKVLESIITHKENYQKQLLITKEFEKSLKIEIYSLFSIIWTLTGFDDDYLSFFVLMEDDPELFIQNEKAFNLQAILNLSKEKVDDVKELLQFKVKKDNNHLQLEIKTLKDNQNEFNEYLTLINSKIQQGILNHIQHIKYYSTLELFMDALNDYIKRLGNC